MRKKINEAEKLFYSTNELDEFKEVILKKLEIAKKEFYFLRSSGGNPNGTDDTGYQFSQSEQGQQVLLKEENSLLATRQQYFINNLENALVRIKNGTYGICYQTGRLISKERLLAVPHTTMCIIAKKRSK